MELQLTLDFLSELARNNSRGWFSENRDKYETARKGMINFTRQMIDAISLFDTGVQGISAEKCLYRIYKDARFLEFNEGPMKENMGAYIAKGGKKGSYAAYYIHIEPGACSLEGGIYSPEAPVLRAVRDEIYLNFDEFDAIVGNRDFKHLFNSVDGKSLVNVPRQYPSDHPSGQYLKMKSFTISHDVPDEMACSSSFPEYAVEVFKAMSPLIQFLNFAIDNVNAEEKIMI